MRLYEYFGNIHMHTTHSDGAGTFDDLIGGAARAGIDFVFVTDHNVLVRESEEGYRRGVLTLVGQEVHDEQRDVPGNHLLCLGVEEDVSHLAQDPQALIDAVRQQDALAFLAHPIEEFTDLLPSHYPWHSWEVKGFHGVELWNYLSSFRGFATNVPQALALGFFPHRFTTGPLPAMLKKWDELTQQRPVVALGGTDVHAGTYNYGPIHRCFLPYDYCARALNTHILTETAFRGPPDSGRTDFLHPHVQHDRQLLLNALGQGHCWIGYDLAGPTNGFRFWAEIADGSTALMGDSVELAPGQSLRLHIESPARAKVRLLRNGRPIAQGHTDRLSYDVRDVGVYRVEVWKERWGRPRGWIFSNPVYVNRPVALAESSA